MAKTIKVARLVEKANQFFKTSPDSARLDRLHVATFLDSVLHETNTYAGFGYLTPYGEPGNDSSRVVYYLHRSLEG
jgi:hypothetical protein